MFEDMWGKRRKFKWKEVCKCYIGCKWKCMELWEDVIKILVWVLL